MDKPKKDSSNIIFWYKTNRLGAESLAAMFEESMGKGLERQVFYQTDLDSRVTDGDH